MSLSTPLQQFETQRVRSETVVIYVRRGCGYCGLALALLARRGIVPSVVDATHQPALRDWLSETTGQFTVPQIFIHGRSIGGYSELHALERSGALQDLMNGPKSDERKLA